jgi:putative ABC transport system permease protein
MVARPRRAVARAGRPREIARAISAAGAARRVARGLTAAHRMDTLLQDLRFAVRGLVRHPGFAVTAITTLALGIGATTAIFSVVDAVLLRPLPFPRADRLVTITNVWTKTGVRSTAVSAPDARDWEARSTSFQAMALYWGGAQSVTLADAADYAGVFVVSPGFFDALGARAAAGRLPTRDQQQPNGPLAAVITDAFWRRAFNASPGAIGSTIKFSDRIFTIAGVMEPGARFPAAADVYVPSWIFPLTSARTALNYTTIARLRDGVSVTQANAELLAIAQSLEREYPDENSGKVTDVVPLQESLVGQTRPTLYTLLGAVGLVLLIACANVANLLLSRATSRAREMTLRAAVGAGRGRLVRQLLTESAVLGFTAALCGAWLARLGMLGLIALAPASLPRIDEIRVDGIAFLFAVGTALGVSLLFGLAPALQASRVQLGDGLRQGGKGASIGARGGRARSAFVVVEIALAVVLVAAAGLLTRSLAALAAVDMGFASERLLVLQTSVPVRGSAEAPRAVAFYRELLPELRALPGISAVAAVRSPPTIVKSNGGYRVEGDTAAFTPRSAQALFNVVTPGYFEALGIPMRRGRDIADSDTYPAAPVAVINEALARASFAGQDPIGRRIQCGLDRPDFMTIVGIVGDIRARGPARSPQPEIYMPFEQHPNYATALTIVARTNAADPRALVDTIRRKIADRNPDVPVRPSTMDQTIAVVTSGSRFQTFLLVTFGSVALLLALAGVYGVMAYSVTQRVPEFGVRVALGAAPRDIRGLVLGEGARLAGMGLGAGLVLALASGRVLQGLLFGVTPRDPLILSLVVATVAVTTLVACYIPVRRAVRVDPIVALRAE